MYEHIGSTSRQFIGGQQTRHNLIKGLDKRLWRALTRTGMVCGTTFHSHGVGLYIRQDRKRATTPG